MNKQKEKEEIIRQIKLWAIDLRDSFKKFKNAKENYEYWTNKLIVLEKKK